MLLSIAKLQNLKAIHNFFHCSVNFNRVVINHKTTKFESNSQRGTSWRVLRLVVINRKTTKFESNSQLDARDPLGPVRCYQSQNYKI